MGYTEDFKIAVVEFQMKGNSIKKTSETFGVGTTIVSDWKRIFVSTSRIERKIPDKSKKRKVTPEKLDELLRENSDIMQTEIAEKLGCTPQAVCNAMKKFGFSRKKNKIPSKKQTQ